MEFECAPEWRFKLQGITKELITQKWRCLKQSRNIKDKFPATQDKEVSQVRQSEATSPSMTTPAASTSVQAGVNFSSGQEKFVRRYFTIDPNDPIVQQWHLLRPEVSDIVKDLPWAVLSVVRVSYQPPPSPPSRDPESNTHILDINIFQSHEFKPESNPIILIGAPAESQGSWLAMANRIYSLCESAGFGHARVLFQSVRYPLTASPPFEDSHRRFADAAEFAENVPIGSSFGPVEKERQTSASMGGTITLQETENDKKLSALLLSVFHPFWNLVKEEERLHGYRRNSTQKAIMSRLPSIQDINHETGLREKIISQSRDIMDSNIQKFEWTREENFQQRAAKAKEQYEEQQALLQMLHSRTSGNQGLGVLEYASGFKSGLDWSLSSFSDRKIINAPPGMNEVLEAIQKVAYPYPVDYLDPVFKYLPSKEIGLSSSETDSYVIKRGRTTGLTAGKVNVIPSDLLLSRSLGLGEGVSFEVYAILPASTVAFAASGDSGAWVLNMDGDWTGSIVGIHDHALQGASIVLAIEAEKIVKDIEAFTSKMVVSPTAIKVLK